MKRSSEGRKESEWKVWCSRIRGHRVAGCLRSHPTEGSDWGLILSNTQPRNRTWLKEAIPPLCYRGDLAQQQQASLGERSIRTPADKSQQRTQGRRVRGGTSTKEPMTKSNRPSKALCSGGHETHIPSEWQQREWVLKCHIHITQQWKLANCR